MHKPLAPLLSRGLTPHYKRPGHVSFRFVGVCRDTASFSSSIRDEPTETGQTIQSAGPPSRARRTATERKVKQGHQGRSSLARWAVHQRKPCRSSQANQDGLVRPVKRAGQAETVQQDQLACPAGKAEKAKPGQTARLDGPAGKIGPVQTRYPPSQSPKPSPQHSPQTSPEFPEKTVAHSLQTKPSVQSPLSPQHSPDHSPKPPGQPIPQPSHQQTAQPSTQPQHSTQPSAQHSEA
jgi:hypothetical protein